MRILFTIRHKVANNHYKLCAGELSEKQKMELERNLNLVKCQESELNMLRQKLFAMSNLVDKKDKDLKTAAEELR